MQKLYIAFLGKFDTVNDATICLKVMLSTYHLLFMTNVRGKRISKENINTAAEKNILMNGACIR